MTHCKCQIEIQCSDTVIHSIPSEEQLLRWSELVYQQIPLLRDEFTTPANSFPLTITLRIVDQKEISELNHSYRQKERATNVLSFPFELPEGIPLELFNEVILGDIILCSEVINNEAIQQHKSVDAHWAHMVIHGHLHLLGYDHIDPSEANIMEGHEIKLLKQLGFANPYHPLQPPSSHFSEIIDIR